MQPGAARDGHGFNEHFKTMNNCFARALVSRISRISRRILDSATGIDGGLTAEQKANIEEMERDYEELIGSRCKGRGRTQSDQRSQQQDNLRPQAH